MVPEEAGERIPWQGAVACRDGLAIALLAARPLRLKHYAA
jgi:hypothetical protein